jgi:hypothetical protein
LKVEGACSKQVQVTTLSGPHGHLPAEWRKNQQSQALQESQHFAASSMGLLPEYREMTERAQECKTLSLPRRLGLSGDQPFLRSPDKEFFSAAYISLHDGGSRRPYNVP